MKMILTSEYFGGDRRAELYLEKNTRSYWVVGQDNDQEVIKEHFLMRGRAEDWAEDWVEGRIPSPGTPDDSSLDTP